MLYPTGIRMTFKLLLVLLFSSAVVARPEQNKQDKASRLPFGSDGVPFIINGWTAKRGTWPWQASLQHNGSGVWNHGCGAVVLSENYIMTAAHCSMYMGIHYPTSLYRVVLGAHDISDENDGYVRSIHQAFNHPNFSMSTDIRNDISILELDAPAVFNQFVQPAVLPDTEDSFVGASCYITGWGVTNRTTGKVPRYLQELSTGVISNAFCQTKMPLKVYDYNICVYNNNGSACHGDSGGPLHCRRSGHEEWMVTGVTSWGSSACLTSSPSVYTRTSSFIPWIRTIVEDDLRFPDRNTTGI